MANHIIETSTSALGNFIYQGTYETILGEYLGGVPRNLYNAAENAIGELAVEIIFGAFNDMFPNDFYIDDDFSLTYNRTYSPKYYNFETDSVIFDFEYSDELKNWMFNYVSNNDDFEKFLNYHYTSRDGFLSFTPNNWHDWLDGWNDDEWRCVSALLRFMIEREIDDSEKDSLWYSFNERLIEIIGEEYTPFEYAEKFNNGYIAAIYGMWDDNNQRTVYNGYLFDECGNVVNHAVKYDAYDDDYHMSAYAVWEYSSITQDLTKDYDVDFYHSEPCDAPVFNCINKE